MSEHTKEPWSVDRYGDVRNSDGQPVGLYRPKNRDRIVACVNACAGIETETLEGIGVAESQFDILAMREDAIRDRLSEAETLLGDVLEMLDDEKVTSALHGHGFVVLCQDIRAFLKGADNA